jgi:hypothetical protein
MKNRGSIVQWLLLLMLATELVAQTNLLSYEEQKLVGAAPEPSAVVTVSGEGVWQQAKSRDSWHPVRNGEGLPLGSLLMTDAYSAAVVELPGGQGLIQVARNSVVEYARNRANSGTLLILTAGRVSGGVSDTSLEILSSCGGGLTLTAPPGTTAPFEFRHGRDTQRQAALRNLGLTSDWARFMPTEGMDDSNFGLGTPSRVPLSTSFTAPETWALLIVGSITVGYFMRSRR